MASVLSYINTGTVSSGFVLPAGAWCKPRHKPTCCIFITGGNTCCMCVPTSATCFIIEMWGQGGGGAGGCCCGSGPMGGQGGAYGWVACTSSGTNHILCGCVCYCSCSTCGICSGPTGQFTRVCDCGVGPYWCVCGGVGGIWCCNFGGSSCCCCGSRLWNTWLTFKTCSAQLAAPAASSSSSFAGTSLPACCTSQTGGSVGSDVTSFTGCSGSALGGGGSSSNPLNNIWGQLCTCACFTSPYVWLGACGWSDPAYDAVPAGCLNSQGGPAGAQCGGGMGVGGASYAGGDQAWQKCTFQCYSCWVQHGNYPGGGGMTSWGYTAWTQPGMGAPGLILMSWC